MTTGLRSGQVATAAGVNRQTLRYYERRGLLAEPERSLWLALDVGCEDVLACAASSECPLPFAELAVVGSPARTAAETR